MFIIALKREKKTGQVIMRELRGKNNVNRLFRIKFMAQNANESSVTQRKRIKVQFQMINFILCLRMRWIAFF